MIIDTGTSVVASEFEAIVRSVGCVKQDASATGTLDRVREALHLVHGQTISELLDAWHLKVAAAIEASSPRPHRQPK
jgi:hypothetical protein